MQAMEGSLGQLQSGTGPARHDGSTGMGPVLSLQPQTSAIFRLEPCLTWQLSGVLTGLLDASG